MRFLRPVLAKCKVEAPQPCNAGGSWVLPSWASWLGAGGNPVPALCLVGHHSFSFGTALVRTAQAKGNTAFPMLIGLLGITSENICPTADLNFSSLPNFQLQIFFVLFSTKTCMNQVFHRDPDV